jgi:hypothetical protein
VYVLTNQVTNSVAAFTRAADGTLTPAGVFPTGVSGNPVAQPGDPPTDPLASQGSLILSPDNNFLFAVNAGSNEISSFAVGAGGLTLVAKVGSGGDRPISLTLRGNMLYVLNEGGTPNITGFTVSATGQLTPLAGSTRPLSEANGNQDPAEVSFSAFGDFIAVTEKATSRIDLYWTSGTGLTDGPDTFPSNGLTPFGFAFDGQNHLVVSEAFGGQPKQGAASSYVASRIPGLSVVSGSVHNAQTASCWVVITANGRFVYTTNTGSGTITSYLLGTGGTLALLNRVAASTGPGSTPIDMALSSGSAYLYTTDNGTQMVHAFRVGTDGSLTAIGYTGGLPFGVQGIAAR